MSDPFWASGSLGLTTFLSLAESLALSLIVAVVPRVVTSAADTGLIPALFTMALRAFAVSS